MCKFNQEVHWQLLNNINSEKRMLPYLKEFPGEPICALEMYLWNTKISAQFWQVIGFTEIALRNRIDPQFSAFVMSEVIIFDYLDEEPKCRNHLTE